MPPPIRYFLAFLILVMPDVRGTSIAEEINFEVANMRESANSDPQVQFDMEYEQDDTGRDDSDEPEGSPSEIIETHVLPDEATAEELNVQLNRPRRRRRRRRRKRPKPTAAPEDLESYYSVPEEENKRKPIKYRLPDANDEAPPDAKIPPRRRNQKRRRRPLKRPAVEDYLAVDEQLENANHTDEQHPFDYSNNDPEVGENEHRIPEPENDSQSSVHIAEETPIESTASVARKPVKDNEVPRIVHEESPNSQKIADSRRPTVSIFDDNPKHEVSVAHEGFQFPNRNIDNSAKSVDDHKFKHNREPEIPKQPILAEPSPKRRKRPPIKTENHDTPKPEPEPAKAETTHTEIKNHASNTRKHETRNPESRESNKTNTIESVKAKTDSKPTEQGKKDLFKIRRLPPTSAILRHFKGRPLKNITGPTKFEVRVETPIRTDENLSNDIPHTAETSTSKPEIDEPASSTPHEKSELSTEMEKPTDSEERFEFPILKYTGQRQTTKPTTPVTTSTTAASTTENTAFIYISCNHTINEVLKNTFNFTGDNITLAATKYLNLIQNHTNNEAAVEKTLATPLNHTEDETMDALKSVAMEELEKLLQQVRTEATVSNSTEARNASTKTQIQRAPLVEHLDSGESESQLDYHVQSNVVAKTSTFPLINEPPAVRVSTEQYFREAKWFQDQPKYKAEGRDDHKYENPFAKPSAGSNKELILTYTSTNNPNLFYNEIDQEENVFREKEVSLHLRNNNNHTSYRKIFNENVTHRKGHAERKKLPLAVKSAIIISGAILALAVLGFFALLLSCKIRQAKSRMKCQRELYREQFQNSEFRQSSRSTSPVVSKSTYNGRSFNNNIQSNVTSNRNYYLWQTLRKTFQYD